MTVREQAGRDAFANGDSRRLVVKRHPEVLRGWELAAAEAQGWQPAIPTTPAVPAPNGRKPGAEQKWFWPKFDADTLAFARAVSALPDPVRSVFGDLRRHARLIVAVAEWQQAEKTMGLPIPDEVLAEQLGQENLLWIRRWRRSPWRLNLDELFPAKLLKHWRAHGSLPPSGSG